MGQYKLSIYLKPQVALGILYNHEYEMIVFLPFFSVYFGLSGHAKGFHFDWNGWSR